MRALKIILFLAVGAMLIGGAMSQPVVIVPTINKLDDRGIPTDYYNRRCVIPLGMPVKTWLTALKWDQPYEAQGWDCSQMSAYTEWALENCGYEASIILIQMGPYGHAFVIAKIDGEWGTYEATSREWMPVLGTILPRMLFSNIYRLYYFRDTDFNREWAWWLEDDK